MKKKVFGAFALGLLVTQVSTVHAALSVDRSRLIYNQGDKSISVNVTNRNAQDPYLAQSWMEDASEHKLNGPLVAIPPVQRIEGGSKTLVRIQALPDVVSLPADRETVFWFNLREIPPKSDKPNTLTLAMQSRLKVFYRPAAIKVGPTADVVPGTETLTLSRQGDKYIVHNPTPYHFSFVEYRVGMQGKGLDNVEPVMVAPKSEVTLGASAARLGNHPVLMFINDFGSQRLLPFSCNGASCQAGKPVMVNQANK